jgi:endonuclease/exonuclease/phosphatase family metal-dependent hydrolase
VRIATWNVQGRVGDWCAREEALSGELARLRPDVVALQESWVEPGGATQAAVLGERLGMHAATAAALAGFERYPEAPYWVVNALLSRWPLDVQWCRPLPDERGVPSWRHLLVARVERPEPDGGPFLAASTHLEHGLDRSPVRRAQARSLARSLAACVGDQVRRREANPVVLGADLNAVPWSDEVRHLTGAAGPYEPGFVLVDAWDAAGNEGRGDTWSAANGRVPARAVHPNRRLDYVLVSWPRRRGAGHVASCRLAGTSPVDGVWPSDHHAVVADLDL